MFIKIIVAILVVGFFAFALFGIVRDVRRYITVKKAQKDKENKKGGDVDGNNLDEHD